MTDLFDLMRHWHALTLADERHYLTDWCCSDLDLDDVYEARAAAAKDVSDQLALVRGSLAALLATVDAKSASHHAEWDEIIAMHKGSTNEDVAWLKASWLKRSIAGGES